MKRIIIFSTVLATSLVAGYRIQKIKSESDRSVHNIVRIHAESGIPREYVVAKKTTDFLEEPIYISNGRALVSTGRIDKFKVGQSVKGTKAVITFVSKDIDLDSGMFVLKFSKNITGDFMIMRKFTGFFLPMEAELPKGARIIDRDALRIVATGLQDDDKIIVR